MAVLADKYVKLPQLGTFKTEADKVYVAQEAGKGLIETEKVTKLDGIEAKAQVNKVEGIQINGEDLTPDGETKVINITAEDLSADLKEYAKSSDVDTKLQDYTKTTELANDPGLTGKFLDKETAGTTYVKEADFDSKVEAKIGEFGTIQGSCEQADLESKKEGAKENDIWIVTDDDNHMYFYNGTDFVDTQAKAHVDLSNYVEKDGNKVLVDPATVTQVDTNKQSIESLQTTVSGLDDTYVKTADMQVATDEDIKGIFSPAE